MPVKKTILSVLMFFLFGVYAIYEHANADKVTAATIFSGTTTHTPLSGVQPIATTQGSQTPIPIQTQTTLSKPAIARRGDDEGEGESEDDGYAVQQTQPVSTPTPVPVQTPTQTPAPTPVPQPASTPAPRQTGTYRDGTYTGSSVYAYYGYVQVQAIVQGGKLADVKFLQYPNDRSTSRTINSQAMPLLTQEAVQAQSAQVDGVSGASDTSAGFVQSLSVALAKA